jgi:SAM-dependent methyltransferase
MSYAIERGVPLLLPEHGAPQVDRSETQILAVLPDSIRGAASKLRPYLVPDMTHKSRQTRRLIPAFAASVSGSIINVGSGTKRYGAHVLNLDIAAMDGVDVVGVAERLPLRGESFDGAILQAVLEHVEDAQATLAELNRVLRPGGMIFVEIPFMQGYHGGPSDFRRFTELGLQRELERHGFEVAATGVAVGPGSGAAWILSEYLALLFSVGARSYRASRLATRWLAWPLKWTDVWLDRHPLAFAA